MTEKGGSPLGNVDGLNYAKGANDASLPSTLEGTEHAGLFSRRPTAKSLEC